MSHHAPKIVIVVALIAGIAAGVYTGWSNLQAERALAEVEPAAAKPATVPEGQTRPARVDGKPEAQDKKNPSHVRLSNVKTLVPPVEKNPNLAAPEKAKPAGEEESD